MKNPKRWSEHSKRQRRERSELDPATLVDIWNNEFGIGTKVKVEIERLEFSGRWPTTSAAYVLCGQPVVSVEVHGHRFAVDLSKVQVSA